MTYRIVVHEDRNPFVRTEVFATKKAYMQMLAQTHHGLIDKGYALRTSDEKDGQQALTYGWVASPEPLPRIHVSVIRE